MSIERNTGSSPVVERSVKRDELGEVEYREQYDGYFSQGWRTGLSAEVAYGALLDSGLIDDVAEIEGEMFGGELWYVDTENGSFYWARNGDDPFHRAGVLVPDGFDSSIISRWRAITLCEIRDGH